MSALLTSIYTLTSTHCGTGQAGAAVDLPIAREATTGFPILPSTSVKGSARAALERAVSKSLDDAEIGRLFGPKIDQSKGDALSAGELIFGEGKLLLYPFRSLAEPVLFGTCPIILEQLDRLLRAHGLPSPIAQILKDLETTTSESLLMASGSGSVVIEDRLFQGKPSDAAKALGVFAAGLLPDGEDRTRERLLAHTVVLSDEAFLELIRRVTPVSARIKLTEQKTTDRSGEDEGEKGNLWYEETLPSDCLFTVLLSERSGYQSKGKNDPPLEALSKARAALLHGQIGGNETVGQGLCWWNIPELKEGA